MRYGNMRDLVLGLEVVLPDGRVWNGLRALRKDNMGYDLKQLFIGAEGTLGVITAAVLRLFPLPGSRLTAWLALEDLKAATALLALAREQTGDAVTTFELVPRIALELVTRHLPQLRDPLDEPHQWYVLMEVSWGAGAADADVLGEALLEQALEQGLIRDAAIAQSESQRLAMWRIRESIPEAQRLEGPSIKHDVSVSVQDMPRFISEAAAAVLEHLPRARLIAYGHLGDGNVHFNLSPGERDPAEGFTENAEEVHRIVYEIVARYGGSIAAEHGVGRLKREALRSYRGGVELELMRALKAALDPMGLMNPGKVL
jgi:FAD/FMN-containing dehydrogenase